RVCGMIPFGRIGGRVGAYAEAAAVDPSWLAPLPDSVGFEEGSTLPLNVLTAHQGLANFDLAPGSRLLVTGASGGVGGFVVELALCAGLHVIAVAGRDDEAWVRSLGAHEVLPRDADLTGLDTVDGVYDAVPVGPDRFLPALREGGTAVFTRAPQPATSPHHRFETVRVQSDAATLAEMARLLGEGALHTRVSRVLPLRDAAEAHRLVEAGGLRGKVVLRG
ncbi:MAG TPA: NADP-dependent oxidoreductase, partial [Archangium sp.]